MKIATVIIGDDGEITLPPEVCERLGVSQGDEIEFVLDDQGVHLRPKRQEENPFLVWVGAIPLPDGETTEQWLRETRHEDMSDEELRILRSGPGAQVVRISELHPELGIGSADPQVQPFVSAMTAFENIPRDKEFKLERSQDEPGDPDL